MKFKPLTETQNTTLNTILRAFHAAGYEASYVPQMGTVEAGIGDIGVTLVIGIDNPELLFIYDDASGKYVNVATDLFQPAVPGDLAVPTLTEAALLLNDKIEGRFVEGEFDLHLHSDLC